MSEEERKDQDDVASKVKEINKRCLFCGSEKGFTTANGIRSMTSHDDETGERSLFNTNGAICVNCGFLLEFVPLRFVN